MRAQSAIKNPEKREAMCALAASVLNSPECLLAWKNLKRLFGKKRMPSVVDCCAVAWAMVKHIDSTRAEKEGIQEGAGFFWVGRRRE